MNWMQAVHLGLRISGGKAHLSELYKTVGTLRVAAGLGLPIHFQAKVRQTLEINSRGRGHDCFIMHGDGYWSTDSSPRISE